MEEAKQPNQEKLEKPVDKDYKRLLLTAMQRNTRLNRALGLFTTIFLTVGLIAFLQSQTKLLTELANLRQRQPSKRVSQTKPLPNVKSKPNKANSSMYVESISPQVFHINPKKTESVSDSNEFRSNYNDLLKKRFALQDYAVLMDLDPNDRLRDSLHKRTIDSERITLALDYTLRLYYQYSSRGFKDTSLVTQSMLLKSLRLKDDSIEVLSQEVQRLTALVDSLQRKLHH